MDKPPKGAALSEIRAWDKAQARERLARIEARSGQARGAGWPCQCGHYRHDTATSPLQPLCSGTLGSMLDTDDLRPDDDRSQPCVCLVYVPVDEDWAYAVGFNF